MLGQLQLSAALRQHRLAVTHFIDSILIPAFGHLVGGNSRVKIGPRDELLVKKLLRPVAIQPRLSQGGLGLPNRGSLFGIHLLIVRALREQPQPGAGLLQCRVRLLRLNSKIRGFQPGDHLSLANTVAKIDFNRSNPAAHLHCQIHLILSRQRAGRFNRPRHPLFACPNYLDFARFERALARGAV
jgi:hypothetical protein